MILSYNKFTFDITIPTIFVCDKLEQLEKIAVSEKLFILDESSLNFLFNGEEYKIYDFEEKLYNIEVNIKKGIKIKESNVKFMLEYINNCLYTYEEIKVERWNLSYFYRILREIKSKKSFILNEEGYRYKILDI
jgi:hypothetical protein